jgi:hypothetical protein
VLSDFPTTNFIGSQSLDDNLALVPRDIKIDASVDEGLHGIFADLDEAVPHAHLERMEEMVALRWEALKERLEDRAERAACARDR